MPYPYQDIAKFVALRTRQIEGGDEAARRAAFEAVSIDTELDGADIPWGSLKRDIIAVATELANAIANSNNPQFRRALQSESLSVASPGLVPLNDAAGVRFIGSFDAIYDATDGKALTEQPFRVVSRRIENAGAFYKIPAYYYAMLGSRIYHTRPNVRFRGCAWDVDQQSTLFDTVGTVPATRTFNAGNVDTATDQIDITAHPFYTGLRVQLTTDGTLPAPLTPGQFVFIIVEDVDNIAFANTYTDALLNNRINLTTAGSGTHTVTPQEASVGGLCPLPDALKVLHACKVLARQPQEDWLANEGGYYQGIADRLEADVIAGRAELKTLPAMPLNTVNADPIKG